MGLSLHGFDKQHYGDFCCDDSLTESTNKSPPKNRRFKIPILESPGDSQDSLQYEAEVDKVMKVLGMPK